MISSVRFLVHFIHGNCFVDVYTTNHINPLSGQKETLHLWPNVKKAGLSLLIRCVLHDESLGVGRETVIINRRGQIDYLLVDGLVDTAEDSDGNIFKL